MDHDKALELLQRLGGYLDGKAGDAWEIMVRGVYLESVQGAILWVCSLVTFWLAFRVFCKYGMDEDNPSPKSVASIIVMVISAIAFFVGCLEALFGKAVIGLFSPEYVALLKILGEIR